MNIIPYGNIVVVLPDAPPETTKAGIFIPEMNQNKPRTGKVVAVGKGLYDAQGNLVPMQSKIFDQVVYMPYSGIDFELGDNKLLMLRESDILGKLERAPE